MVRNLVMGLALISVAGCSAREDSAICSTPEQVGEVLKLPHDYANQIKKVDNCLHRWAFRLAGSPGSINEVAQATIGACRDMIPIEVSLFMVENKLPSDQASVDHWEAKFRGDALDLARFYVAMSRAGKCAIPQM